MGYRVLSPATQKDTFNVSLLFGFNGDQQLNIRFADYKPCRGKRLVFLATCSGRKYSDLILVFQYRIYPFREVIVVHSVEHDSHRLPNDSRLYVEQHPALLTAKFSRQLTDELKKGDSDIIGPLDRALPDHILVGQISLYFDDQIYVSAVPFIRQFFPGIPIVQRGTFPILLRAFRLGIEAQTG